MGINSKWTTGGLEFYQTGTTYVAFRIPKSGHGFEFGESGNGFDIVIHGVTTGYKVDFDASSNLIDFNGINITQNDAFRTDTTGTATTGTVTLSATTSPRWQFLAPSSAAGDVLVKLPAASESGGVMFTVYNGISTGSGWAGGSNLLLTTTGMGATTGTILDTLVKGQLCECYCDGLGWRLHPTTTV